MREWTRRLVCSPGLSPISARSLPSAPLAQGRRLRIETAYDPRTIAIGASISCAGVCLTVTGLPEAGSNARWFEVEAWEEALRLTTAGAWQPGTRINLERALKIGDELGGHIVSGHVDGMADIVAREAVARRCGSAGSAARAGQIRCVKRLGRA